MGKACIAIILFVIVGIILLFIGGWQLLVGVIVAGIIALVLWLRSKESDEYLRKAQLEQQAVDESQQMWQRASQSNKMVRCKTCGAQVAESSPVCPSCGVTLPGLRVTCPKCKSSNITVAKKGFSVGQAAAGGIAVGTVGLAAGMIGSGDAQFVCLACNYKWKVLPSQKTQTVSTPTRVRSTRRIGQPSVKLKEPYTWRKDIQKYRCEYCYQAGHYHYCRTLNGIKRHIRDSHTNR